MACGCGRLRLGGTTLDGIYALHPYSWDGLWGFPGRRGSNPPVIGRSGTYRVPSKEAQERRATLGLQIRRKDDTGAVTLPEGGCEHLEFNQDEALGLIGTEDLLTLEFDRADGTTRYLEVEVIDGAPISFHGDEQRLQLVMLAPYPQWQLGGTATTTTVSGLTNLNPGGRAAIENPVLSFSGDSKITNALTGDGVGVDAPSYGSPVLVDLATGLVTQGGVLAGQFVNDVDTSRIFHLRPNVVNALNVTGAAVDVIWRPQWW